MRAPILSTVCTLVCLILTPAFAQSQTTTVSGRVSSDCDGALAGIQVMLDDWNAFPPETFVTTTDANGIYAFDGVSAMGLPVMITAELPVGYAADFPPDWQTEFPVFPDMPGPDFTASCPSTGVDVTGRIRIYCISGSEPGAGITVNLDLNDGAPLTTVSDQNGDYSFTDLTPTGTVPIWLDIPEDLNPLWPPGAMTQVFLNQDHRSDFYLACIPDTTCVYFEDFESDDHGWSPFDATGGGAVQWNVANYDAGDGHGSRGVWWCGSDDACLLPGSPPGYGVNWDQRLSRSFTLPTSPISLTLTHQYDTESDWDFNYVEISTDDGASFTTLAAFDGNSSGFATDAIDLSAYAEMDVIVRLRFKSDGGYDDADGRYDTDGAWRIDAIQIGAESYDFEGLNGQDWVASTSPDGFAAFRLHGESPTDPPEEDPCGPPPPPPDPNAHGHYWVAYDPETDVVPFNSEELLAEGGYIRIGIESPWIDIPTDASEYVLSLCYYVDQMDYEQNHWFRWSLIVENSSGCEEEIFDRSHYYFGGMEPGWYPIRYGFSTGWGAITIPQGTSRIRARLHYVDTNGTNPNPVSPHMTDADANPSIGPWFDNIMVSAINTDAAGVPVPNDLTCPTGQGPPPDLVSVSGTVHADCLESVEGITLDLLTPDGYYHTTSTDALGNYTFQHVYKSSESGEVTVMSPLGTQSVSPPDGHVAVDLSDEQTGVDFTLECVTLSAGARTIGYWKHQANAHLRGKGRPHESLEDMETNFPELVFDHFHENELNGIAVEGVTYISDECPLPITLETIQTTLTVNNGGTMLDRAKQQYLALLLNLASGKLQTMRVVSEDSATTSQAVQECADLILDGDDSNDEIAKDIADTINNGQLVPMGVIRNWENIPYRHEHPSTQLSPSTVFALHEPSPNPFNPSTVIRYDLSVSGRTILRIYDSSGRLTRELVRGWQAAGGHRLSWDGTDTRGRRVASGVYYLKLVSNGGQAERRLVLLK